MQFELSFDNDPRSLAAVEAFVESALRQLPLADDDGKRLCALINAAAHDAVARAYPNGETGTLQLSIRDSGGRLEIRIRDFGLPQDVGQMEARLQSGVSLRAWLRAAQQTDVVDEVHWLAFGPQGKALQLVKWLHRGHIAAGLSPDELTPAVAPLSVGAVPLAPPQEYTVRRLLPSEATQVSQLMYRTYGGTYFNADVYYPDRIASLNQEQEVISVIAVGEDGRVAAHCALERNRLGQVAEIGQAAVDPAHRGRGLLDRMKQLLEGEARSLGLVGWYADAVTVHTFTQQSDAHHGGHVCGVDLAVSPESESFRGIAQHLRQRVSCVLYFRWLGDPAPRTLYVPARHEAITAAIYDNLQAPYEFGESTPPTAEHGEHSVKLAAGAALGTVHVESLGRDSVPAIRHAVRELVEQSRAEVVVVELPLVDPACGHASEQLEADGLAFTGVGPHFSPRGDILKLTYLVRPLAREPIKTFEPLAARLVEYALAEQNRVRAGL
ncbi:MAG: GNAT family N-acetyltransferase [Pirellulales bacterium]|nr:GNAT family N-acetyltransferase [Pirellulales bacterium]